MQARDIMTTGVISVAPDTPVQEIAQVLLDNRISAVPVIDERGRLAGIVSEGDLIHQYDEDGPRSWWLRVFSSPSGRLEEYLKSHGTTAAHVMTEEVISVAEDAPVGEVAALLEDRQIKRVPVVRGDEVVGIVSRSNLLQAIVAGGDRLRTPPSDDRALRAKIMAALGQQEWLTQGLPNPIVSDGACELWGAVGSEKERQALNLLVSEVPGVREVRDHLVVRTSKAHHGYI